VRENVTRLGGWRGLGSTQRYLIQTGPYRYSRNPMYLAAALIWLGRAMLFGNLYLLAGLLVALGVVSALGIPFEERRWRLALETPISRTRRRSRGGWAEEGWR
jgi:protein-S-isoprenylcysteine O-methyltransferase Ste14